MSHLMLQSWSSAITAAMILTSGAVLLLAAWHDVVSRTVPNWMSVAIAGCGVVAAFASGRLLVSAGLGLAVFFAAAICWRRGWIGGADVKLLGAIAIVLPPGMVSMFAVAMSLAGAAHAAVYILARRMVTRPTSATPLLASPLLASIPSASQLVSPLATAAASSLAPRRAAVPPRARSLLPRAMRAERWRISRGGPLPYACAIAFGFLFVVCNGGAP
jgi:prepilin peptidase CpaA